MKTAEFNFTFDSEKDARIIAESIDPEIKNKIPKTNVEVNISGKTFFIKIQAKELSPLRAACNSYLRWINTAINVKKMI